PGPFRYPFCHGVDGGSGVHTGKHPRTASACASRPAQGSLPMKKSVFSRLMPALLPLLLFCAYVMPALAAGDGDAPRRGAAGLTRTEGYVPFYFDGARGRVLMEIPVFDQDVLYYVSAATNPGSVEAPFDRGIIFSSVIHFERSGGKVVVNQINMGFRAVNGSPKTQEGVADSFPTSVLAVLPIESGEKRKAIAHAPPQFRRHARNVAA